MPCLPDPARLPDPDRSPDTPGQALLAVPQRLRRRTFAWGGLALLAGGLARSVPAASTATLSVYVVTPGGQPAPGVVVEVALSGAPRRVPDEPVVIAQRGLRFLPQVTAVPAGTTVRFVNEDAFEHHLRSQPAGALGSIEPARQFDFRMAAAQGGSVPSQDVLFDRPGLVVLGCHFHSSMRGHLYVAESSLLAVTDAAGRAEIVSMPAGAARVRLWHPEQLVEQPLAALQVQGAASLTATLNFQPRPRARAR